MARAAVIARPSPGPSRPLSECCGALLCGGPAVLWCGTCGRTVHGSWPGAQPVWARVAAGSPRGVGA